MEIVVLEWGAVDFERDHGWCFLNDAPSLKISSTDLKMHISYG